MLVESYIQSVDILPVNTCLTKMFPYVFASGQCLFAISLVNTLWSLFFRSALAAICL